MKNIGVHRNNEAKYGFASIMIWNLNFDFRAVGSKVIHSFNPSLQPYPVIAVEWV